MVTLNSNKTQTLIKPYQKQRKMLESRLITIIKKSKSFQKFRYSAFSSPTNGCFSTYNLANTSTIARTCFINGFRSFHHFNKGTYKPAFRHMSTLAATAVKGYQETVMLVTSGPHAQKAVGLWLIVSAACVFTMVILGGGSRRTRSGLSMTDWKLTGSLPLSDEDWAIEFEKYKQSPEFNRVNIGMDINDFKYIYQMEYVHRMWGRALGIVFALPFSYFMRKGYINLRLGVRLAGIFALGWWMVESGVEEPSSECSQPRVSPYRLAARLTSAFAIFSGLLWTALSVLMPEPPTESLAWVKGAAKFRRFALPVSILVGITAVSGTFAAGNDAAHAFNTFPKMGDSWIPEDVLSMKPLIPNFFENTATVQIHHRILATASLASLTGLWWSTRKLDLHPVIRPIIGSTLGMAALQVTLGISTLLSDAPASLATAHQAGAMILFIAMIFLNHTLRRPSQMLLKALQQLPEPYKTQ